MRLDRAHLIHAVSRWKLLKNHPKDAVKDFYKRVYGYAIQIDEFKELEDFILSVLLVCYSEFLVENSECVVRYNQLLSKFRISFDAENSNHCNSEINDKDEKKFNSTLCSMKFDSMIQYLNQLSKEADALVNNNHDFSTDRNPFYFPKLKKNLIATFSHFPAFTNVMQKGFKSFRNVATSAISESYNKDIKINLGLKNPLSAHKFVLFHAKVLSCQIKLVKPKIKNYEKFSPIAQSSLHEEEISNSIKEGSFQTDIDNFIEHFPLKIHQVNSLEEKSFNADHTAEDLQTNLKCPAADKHRSAPPMPFSFSTSHELLYNRPRPKAEHTTKYSYPKAHQDEAAVELLHNVKVKDPYKCLEDSDTEETKAYIDTPNNITQPFIDVCPKRDAIHDRLAQKWDYPKYSCPTKKGSKYYFFINTELQNQSVFYVQDSLDDEPRVFLDPNTLSADGTVTLAGGKFSEDNTIYAYALSASGSDWNTIHFINAKTGTSTIDDVTVVEFLNRPLWRVEGEVTDCGRWLIVIAQKEYRDNLVLFTKIEGEEINGKLPLIEVVGKLDADYEYIAYSGTKAVFRTNKDAPNYKLIMVDLENFKEKQWEWETLLPEHAHNVLDWATAVDGNKLFTCYIENDKNVWSIHSLENGTLLKKLLLGVGTIFEFSGHKKYSEIFYSFTSSSTSEIIYTMDLKTEKTPKVLRKIKVKDFGASLYKPNKLLFSNKVTQEQEVCKREPISNGLRLKDPIVINGQRLKYKYTCAFDSVFEVFVFLNTTNTNFNNLLAAIALDDNNRFLNLIKKYSLGEVSKSEVYTERAHILDPFIEQKYRYADYVDCTTSISLILEKMMGNEFFLQKRVTCQNLSCNRTRFQHFHYITI
uniref:Peptidase S9A N-terminal domain-containing protein n=1 Tax=Trichogramma kaykai TaxID=54128 RepID=A0ABD2XFN7_9HYME